VKQVTPYIGNGRYQMNSEQILGTVKGAASSGAGSQCPTSVADLVTLNAELTLQRDELVRVVGRLLTGLSGVNTPECEWYEGLAADAEDEARAILAALA
jgi:hypothetical protein